MEPEHVQALTGLGLTPSEARLYLALIGEPGARVSEIARRAEVPRARAYRVLARLEARGMVAQRPGVSKRFEAVDPRDLVDRLLAEKRVHLDENARLAFELLRSLSRTAAPGRDPRARVEDTLVMALAGARERVLVQATARDAPFGDERAFLDLDPGVRVRILLEDGMKHPLLERPGAEARTQPALSAAWVVVDGELVLLGSRHTLGSREDNLMVSRNPTLAAVLTEAFERGWATARPASSARASNL